MLSANSKHIARAVILIPIFFIICLLYQSFIPELAMVSRIWLSEKINIAIGTIISTTVTAAPCPVLAIPPPWI
jgi:hypothetical protein